MNAETYHLICITETHLNTTFRDSELNISGFKLLWEDTVSSTGKGGGLLIYVQSELNPERVQSFRSRESLAVYISSRSIQLVVACAYHSPSLGRKCYHECCSNWQKWPFVRGNNIKYECDQNSSTHHQKRLVKALANPCSRMYCHFGLVIRLLKPSSWGNVEWATWQVAGHFG